ncbi:MAG TPA: DUF4395 domain-containing protein [Anaerolinea thermolimosa]|uniref:DUF4395 domain-containing protein n=1 Tax=Anaerolinea thermolimosa TaxID=229919 RepID=A0A3D1JGB6_9CHLR|nr:DUF4395 domain-containing protein [Anaerolinea thermolimosa]GAP06956.1 hypothetical protein ATHL_01822 [Anaerolinea thermolimosa]HCE17533.1 DUF4395 domain-containing protein [Anaerolinea thermolimosa]
MTSLVPMDHSSIKTNQALVMLLPTLAFIFDWPWLVALTSAVMLIGSFFLKRPGFSFLYTKLLQPVHLVKPNVLLDHREPHLFAQGMGGVCLALSALGLAFGLVWPGWLLSWIVVGLAALNFFGGFCAGCAIYYWLNRLHVPGFTQSPPPDTPPGMRPRSSAHE